MSFWTSCLEEHQSVIKAICEDAHLLQMLEQVSERLTETFRKGGQLFLCGNGGSAADSQHIAAEFVGRFFRERAPLNAEALTVNTSCITAIGNDYSYVDVFERQLAAKAKPGDMLIGISTSGNSANVLKAMAYGQKNRLCTVGLTGSNTEAKIGRVSDFLLAAPTRSTPRIQEAHILLMHMLSEHVESTLFP